MAEWTPDEDRALRTCINLGLTAAEAALVVTGRSANACQSRATRQALSFRSGGNQVVRSFLKAGGRLIREDVGGAVGVSWGRASRSGERFDAGFCDQLLAVGLIHTPDGGRTFARTEA